jgi:Xaa-Pro aminopeptidase
LVDEMRLIKDASEIATMRAACDISSEAHVRAMQLSACRLRAGLETREFHLEAELLHVFRQHGAEAPAYTSIVAAGANACVLHYRADRALVQPGELVLIDAGCELGGYASDITRTFPANGVFSGAQRDLYALVLLSQEAAIAHTRVGARFSDPHDASVRVLAQGLLDLGILNPAEHGSVDDVIERKLYTPFYMHRTSHWLGLDVHDCGAYVEDAPHTGESSTPTWSAVLESAAQPSPDAPDRQATTKTASSTSASLPSRRLQANMVLTIEPGLYVRPSDNVPRAFWNIGIRIEDDAWVTPEGAQLLSRGVPVEIAAIEELMRA